MEVKVNEAWLSIMAKWFQLDGASVDLEKKIGFMRKAVEAHANKTGEFLQGTGIVWVDEVKAGR